MSLDVHVWRVGAFLARQRHVPLGAGLIFAPVLVPPGVYVGHHVLQEAKAHSILLNCADSQWFLDGVPGFGDSIEGTAEKLREVIDHFRTPSSKVVAFGGSMGGYGAILLGGLAGADSTVEDAILAYQSWPQP